MFFHGLLAKFWQKIKIRLGFFMVVLLPKQVKSWFIVSRICTFYLTCALLIMVRHFFYQFRKARKIYTLPSTHDLAVGFWVSTDGREVALPSFFDILRFYLNQFNRATGLAPRVWLLSSSFHYARYTNLATERGSLWYQ